MTTYTNFDQLVEALQTNMERKRLLLVAAESKHSLEAVIDAYNQGIIEPVLIGNEPKIRQYLEELDAVKYNFEIIPTATPEDAAKKAADLVNEGKGDVIMKGLIDTSKIFGVLMKRENNMKAGGLVHALCFAEIETHHKLLVLTDGTVNPHLNVDQKRQMIENCTLALSKMGFDTPKIALLSAVEVVNPKMQDTVDNAQLKQEYLDGKITGCIVEGPIAFDLAISKESAEIKGFDSPVAGDADVLIYPDLAAANIGIKTIINTGHNRTGTFIMGFKVPFVMSSRGASKDNKYRSILLACAVGRIQ